MKLTYFPILLFLWLWSGSNVFAQNSTEEPGTIGPASSLNIDTSPVTASTNEVKSKEVLSKYEFYTAMLNLLPVGWQLSERESNIIISRPGVTVQKLPLEIVPNDPILEEEQATNQYGKSTYELVLRFEPYAESQYKSAKDRFADISTQLEQLEEKYAVAEMKLDDGTGWFIARNKDEKNRLVFFHIERATLEDQLKPVPDLYVKDYSVTIEKGSFYKLFPVSVESQLNFIIQQVQTLLK